ncbi:hypothetical protein AACH06_28945 [Ideonella sp. DXS29W]|uniref:Uncharacterized protein n=1 Tax=Ideonella lacteola TaxID=2984193 RepID=A0ABU9C1Z2_9BURK
MFLFLSAIVLGIATPFSSALLSWGYLDQSSRVGFWYYWLWLFQMPENFTKLLPFTPSPGGRVLASMLGYMLIYRAAVLLLRSAMQRLKGAGQSR